MLRGRGQYEPVLRSGYWRRSDNFYVSARNNDLSQPRLGLIVARKAARRAVDRNRGKRLIREVYRAHQLALDGKDVVVQLRRDLRAVSNNSVRTELSKLLEAVCRPEVRDHRSERQGI